jgi:hypothetical protein
MLRNRLLIGLGVSFLAVSGAWADEVGYVDCSKNADATQVFGKPRRSTDVVASLPCGERFTILVYGFYFSRIQTKDGQVGYIYSSLIAQDRGATSLQPAASKQPTTQQTPSLQAAAEKTKIPRETPFDAQPKAAAATQPQSAAPQAVAAPSAAVQAAPVAAASTQSPVAAAPVPAAPDSVSSAIGTSAGGTAAPVAQPAPSAAEVAQPAAAQPPVVQPTSAQPAAAPAPVFTTPPTAPPTPSADAPDTTATVAQPSSNPAAEAQPEPAQPAAAQPAAAQPPAAQPAPPAIRPADMRESWEKPRPSARPAPLLELAGSYAFARMGGAGSLSNLNGVVGSFGWNVKSWLQVTADTSYSLTTSGNTQNVLFGNHYGPRFFYRIRNRWGITPFAEALVGGSDLRTTVSGAGGYTAASGSSLSYKVGGGIDIHPSHRWQIRLLDVDYYGTSFVANTHQSNYWITTGVVLRLFGGGAE